MLIAFPSNIQAKETGRLPWKKTSIVTEIRGPASLCDSERGLSVTVHPKGQKIRCHMRQSQGKLSKEHEFPNDSILFMLGEAKESDGTLLPPSISGNFLRIEIVLTSVQTKTALFSDVLHQRRIGLLPSGSLVLP
jgi:hypothetical protein